MPASRKKSAAGTPELRQQLAVFATEHPALVQAYSHPIRVRILALFDGGESELAPVEMATALGLRLGNVSYHVRILADLGILKATRTSPARGALRHHYRIA